MIAANDYYQKQLDFYKKEFEEKSSEEIKKMLNERSLYQKIMVLILFQNIVQGKMWQRNV